MTKRSEAMKLREARFQQIDRAVAARYSSKMPRNERNVLFRERDRQTRLAQEEYKRGIAAKPRQSAATRKQSRFWKHFGQDGLPVPPWETEAGPHVASDDDDDEMDDSLFAEGGYDYEDFDTDWGGYDYSDTGYPDEDA